MMSQLTDKLDEIIELAEQLKRKVEDLHDSDDCDHSECAPREDHLNCHSVDDCDHENCLPADEAHMNSDCPGGVVDGDGDCRECGYKPTPCDSCKGPRPACDGYGGENPCIWCGHGRSCHA